jgi:hypothetical protein
MMDFKLLKFRLISAAILSMFAFRLTQALGNGLPAANASFLDVVVVGNSDSEQNHGFRDKRSQIIQGGLAESARRLLPNEPVSFEGGSISFSLKVDPSLQNYVTVKFWGSDKGAGSGRLVLFANGLQVGYRREGDYDVLNQTDEEGECPGRFLYETLPLPPALTRGKTSVELKIAALGPMWYYGTTFAQYQKDLAEPTRGIYRVYTHTTARFTPDPSEKQGVFQSLGIRSGPGDEVIERSKQIVNDRLAKLLERTATDKPSSNLVVWSTRMLLLSEAYNTPWSAAHLDGRAIEQIIRDGDAMAGAVADDPKLISNDWAGTGPMGEAVLRVWTALQPRMSEKLHPDAETTRGQAWANVLRESVDYWRTHRRAYTNQSMIVDRNIYTTNRGILLIDPDRALPESKALRYLYQAVGLEPWLGSDPAPEARQQAAWPERAALDNGPQPFGRHYYLVTRKGLSRELGWVGSYGETILHFTHDIAELTGDAKIREQLRKLESARMFFRYPGLDADGYQCMKLASEIDNRTAHYPLSGAAYAAASVREEWWMDVPALLSDDPVAVGAAQQSLADNQYFAYVNSRLKDPDTLGMMRNIDQYEKVKMLAPSSYRLPMDNDQPDFVFSDEEDAVLALKHGDTRLFVNLYYRAERAVNGVARVLELNPAMTRIATVRTEFETSPSGSTYTRPDWIDGIRSDDLKPPGVLLHQAWVGDKMPVTARPADAAFPAYDDWGPFLGKASFYRLRYGDYLIAVNTTYDKPFSLAVPADAPANARNLIDNQVVHPGQELTLAPCSTIVLYLGN